MNIPMLTGKQQISQVGIVRDVLAGNLFSVSNDFSRLSEILNEIVCWFVPL
jgi:hypothetical protein